MTNRSGYAQEQKYVLAERQSKLYDVANQPRCGVLIRRRGEHDFQVRDIAGHTK